MNRNPASRSRSDDVRPGGSPAPYGARRLLGERVIYVIGQQSTPEPEPGLPAIVAWFKRWFQ